MRNKSQANPRSGEHRGEHQALGDSLDSDSFTGARNIQTEERNRRQREIEGGADEKVRVQQLQMAEPGRVSANSWLRDLRI